MGGRSIEGWPKIPGVISWAIGERINPVLTGPIQLFWDPKDSKGPPRALYKATIPMMSLALYAALKDECADCLQVFPVEVRSKKTGEVDSNFVAFNIIGLHNDYANESLMGRHAEKRGAILIHDQLKPKLEVLGLGLTFTPPSEWIG